MHISKTVLKHLDTQPDPGKTNHCRQAVSLIQYGNLLLFVENGVLERTCIDGQRTRVTVFTFISNRGLNQFPQRNMQQSIRKT